MRRDHDDVMTEPSEWAIPAPPVAGLRVTVGDGRALGPTPEAVIVGRSAGCDLPLADPSVSSFHVELRATPEGIRVVDLQSRNGSWYAGARVRDVTLPSGATLQVGATLLRVELASVSGAAPTQTSSFGALVGEAPATREALDALARLGRTDLSVLVQGETGTGKELAARGLHDCAPWSQGPFVVLDCASVPPTLAESLLFGHERGAFTGAHEARAGLFEQAHGGTIFLDEVGELPTELQPKLLRVLERREVLRVGGARPLPVRVRVVAATWRDLRVMVNQGSFREDLYYRLAQARVTLPPLRERRGDIPLLVQRFLAGIDRATPCARALLPDALDELCRRDYPGNVRELRSTVERAAKLAAGPVITPADLAFERMIGGASPKPPRAPTAVGDGPVEPFKVAKQSVVEEFERDYLARLLAKTSHNLSRAAALAGVERNHLRDLCRKHGLRSSE